MNYVNDIIQAEDCLASGQLYYACKEVGFISPYSDAEEHTNYIEDILKATSEKAMIKAVRAFQAAQVQYLLKLKGWNDDC